MLQHIRDRFTGGFAMTILAIIVVPFLFFGINYDFIGSSYAAKVNGEEISLAAFDNAYRQQLARYADSGVDLPEQFRSTVKEGVLNRLIGEVLVDQYLASQGYRISDEMIATIIQQQPEFRVDGTFAKERYYSWLAERAQSPAAFEQAQRYRLRQGQRQRGVAATAFVTPAEYRRFLNLYGETREISLAVFDVEAVSANIEVGDADVQSYYDERPDEFRSKESVDLKYVELDRDALRQQVQVTGEELEQHYQESRDRFLEDEQRRARHILVPFGDDEEAARAQAEALAARARAGEPFADLARQYSDDSSTAANGGDLGLLTQSQLPVKLGEAIFSMAQGDIAGPVRTQFGFHVIELDEIRPGGPLPLAEVRAELERELRDSKAQAAWRELEDAVSDALFDADDIDTMAAKLDLEVHAATGFTRAGGADFGSNQAVIDAVFEDSVLHDGRISDIVELDADRAVVVQVTDYHEAERLPLAEVRDDIVGAIKTERARAIVEDKAAALSAAVRDGTDFAAAAGSADATQVRRMTISRQDQETDANVRNAVFELTKPHGDVLPTDSVRTTGGDYAVFALREVTPGRPESVPIAERDQGKSNLAAQAGNADYAALVLELERRADIVRNRDALEQQNLF